MDFVLIFSGGKKLKKNCSHVYNSRQWRIPFTVPYGSRHGLSDIEKSKI